MIFSDKGAAFPCGIWSWCRMDGHARAPPSAETGSCHTAGRPGHGQGEQACGWTAQGMQGVASRIGCRPHGATLAPSHRRFTGYQVIAKEMECHLLRLGPIWMASLLKASRMGREEKVHTTPGENVLPCRTLRAGVPGALHPRVFAHEWSAACGQRKRAFEATAGPGCCSRPSGDGFRPHSGDSSAIQQLSHCGIIPAVQFQLHSRCRFGWRHFPDPYKNIRC